MTEKTKKPDKKFQILQGYLPWMCCLLGMDGFLILILWLTALPALAPLSICLILATLLIFLTLSAVLLKKEQRKKQMFLEFLQVQDEVTIQNLLRECKGTEQSMAAELVEALQKKEQAYTQLLTQQNDYEEYVELWTHEVKTPLSLLTLLLDNHREELPDAVSDKLDYVRNRTQESIDQMLFYARVNGQKKDYLFESVNVRAALEEVLEDYQPLLSEKNFMVICEMDRETVYTDRRSLRFLLGQLVSNSIKYAQQDPELMIRVVENSEQTILEISDNGQGVKTCDLPYIFEKGFTGDSCENRKKATGMGLYLVKKLAEDMNLTLQTESVWQQGFTIRVIFPAVFMQKMHSTFR